MIHKSGSKQFFYVSTFQNNKVSKWLSFVVMSHQNIFYNSSLSSSHLESALLTPDELRAVAEPVHDVEDEEGERHGHQEEPVRRDVVWTTELLGWFLQISEVFIIFQILFFSIMFVFRQKVQYSVHIEKYVIDINCDRNIMATSLAWRGSVCLSPRT